MTDSTPDDPLVTTEDMRALKCCVSGSKAFAARYGLDWARFIREGLPASEFEKTGDYLGVRAAEEARRRERSK